MHHTLTTITLLGSLLVPALRVPAQSATTRAAASQPPSAPATQASGVRTYQPGVQIDWTRKQVLLAGEIVLRQGDLELFACSPGTKEHESIVRVFARPLHVYQALGLVGLEPGRPPLYSNKEKKIVPADGQLLDITVRWTAAGQPREVPIWQWLWNNKTERPAEARQWVFAGSMPMEDDRILADLDGTVITVVDFESAIVALPASHTSDNANLWAAAYTDKIPPQDTPVTIVIRAAHAPLTFHLDRLGRLTRAGQPCTFHQAIDAARAASRDGTTSVTLQYDADLSEIQVRQLAQAFQRAGLRDVTTSPLPMSPTAASDNVSPRTTVEEQGLVVLQTLADLGRQFPSAADSLARSLKDSYQHLSDRARAASQAATGAAKAFGTLQQPPIPQNQSAQ